MNIHGWLYEYVIFESRHNIFSEIKTMDKNVLCINNNIYYPTSVYIYIKSRVIAEFSFEYR